VSYLPECAAFGQSETILDGESVGHYEGGDTLVIDTIGQTDRTFADNYCTPHTTQMHVIERCKLSADGNRVDVSVTAVGKCSKLRQANIHRQATASRHPPRLRRRRLDSPARSDQEERKNWQVHGSVAGHLNVDHTKIAPRKSCGARPACSVDVGQARVAIIGAPRSGERFEQLKPAARCCV
jgi:hypothetical protein